MSCDEFVNIDNTEPTEVLNLENFDELNKKVEILTEDQDHNDLFEPPRIVSRSEAQTSCENLNIFVENSGSINNSKLNVLFQIQDELRKTRLKNLTQRKIDD